MPSRFGLKSWMLASTAAIAALLPCLASAALGEPEGSVAADGVQLHGSITASDQGAYRLHEIQLPSGTLVREYAGLDGTVFAVTWHGPYVPNLRQLLGRYFDAYVAAAKAPTRGPPSPASQARATWWSNRAATCARSTAARTCRRRSRTGCLSEICCEAGTDASAAPRLRVDGLSIGDILRRRRQFADRPQRAGDAPRRE